MSLLASRNLRWCFAAAAFFVLVAGIRAALSSNTRNLAKSDVQMISNESFRRTPTHLRVQGEGN